MPQVPIAVVGVSALFPGSTDAHGFWRDILAGRDLISDVPPSHWLAEDYYDPNPAAPDKTYSKRGAFLSHVPFDPMEFGIPPNTLPATDTSQLLGLIVAQRVLDDATQGQFSKIDRERASVILGVTSGQELLGTMVSRLQRPIWLKALRDSGLPEDEAQAICGRISKEYPTWQESTFPGLLGNVVAGRIANRFDLRGTNAVCDAACASSLAALSMGVNQLALGQSDLVIAGGVDTMNDIFMYMCFSKTPALSPTGDCRPFSDAADGTLLGEGIGMLALRRLADAERDGDRVYAVIRGIGSSSDGRSKSVYAPVPEGQARALRRTYEAAGYGPETVELVEAHGTATKAGDVAEFEGMKLAFGEAAEGARPWCALGSVKSQIGHTKSAAGAAGLFKAVMALHHKVLPPTIKVDRPNPKLAIDTSPFYLNTRSRPWIRDAAHPRRAGVSAFGFGGSNFHVTLEEYVGPAPKAWRARTVPTELVVLSDGTGAGIAAKFAETARTATEHGLAAAARLSQRAFKSTDPARLAIVASSAADLAEKLEQARAKLAAQPAAAFSTPTGIHYAFGDAAGPVAFLFPGQGSQYVGMSADVSMAFDAARAAWDDAASARFDGAALHEVVFPHPVFTDADRDAQTQALTATEWAQPAIGVASLALLNVLSAAGVTPALCGGHSFGELTALTAAGVLDPASFVALARRRGEAMRDASSTPGAMAAVAATIEDVRAHLADLGNEVVVANHNHPTQVVVSGAIDAIEQTIAHLAKKGVTAKRLSVATAFHSPFVASAGAALADALGGISICTPTTEVFSNVDAALFAGDPASIRQRLAEAVAKPVRFVEEIEAMWARGARVFVEVGPGSVLTELVTRILGKRPYVAIALDRKGKHGVTSLQDALGRLSTAGVAVDFEALWDGYAPPNTTPKKKPAMVVSMNGANVGRPYPPPGGAAALPKPNGPRPVQPAPVATHSAEPVSAPVRAAASSQAAVPPAAVVTAAAPSAIPSEAHLAWVYAYQESQRQTADAHAAYLETMAATHTAFLHTVEASFAGLGAMLGGASTLAPHPTAAYAVPIAPAPVPIAPAPVPIAPAPVPIAPVPVPIAPAPVPIAPAPVFLAAPNTAPAPAASAHVDLSGLMLAVVADKTGYPVEMLTLPMDLEADLGIDSIKRVEILSAMRERAPGLPEVNAAEMAALRTLGQIVDYMSAKAGGTSSAPAPAPTRALAAPAAPLGDLEALLLAIVAEKTGYPAEMLGTQMELEADLGIDSIKRVEILSAMRERAPGLPEVNAAEMAALRTLGQIVDYMRGRAGAAAPAVMAASAPSHAPTAPTAPLGDLEALLLAIVAEKTGYPAEMLGTQMELEADLGIDSIKRVEILSAMRERAPGLPEVNAAEMAALRTLGQIVDYMRGRSSGGGSADAAEAEPVAAEPPGSRWGRERPQTPGPHIQRFALVSEPAPACGLALAGLIGARRVVVTDDGGGVAHALVEALAARGVAAEVASSVPADADVVLLLAGLREVGSIDEAVAVNRESFVAAHAVAARFAALGGVFVTVQDTGGDFGLRGTTPVRAWLAGVSALARTAALEWTKASVKAIDLARAGRSPEALATALVEELFGGGPTREVGLRADGSRTTLISVERAVVRGAPVADASSVIVVSGGARGVTAASILALARQCKARVVLLGRSRVEPEPAVVRGIVGDASLKRALLDDARSSGRAVTPAALGAAVARVLAGREIEATLEALRAAGSDARYVPVDVQDGAAVGAALDEIRAAWGPITGVVHGAGVLADKLIAEKTPEQFDRVFDTKVKGLRALLEATANDPLRFVAMFSSVAARTGNLGQVDYAMANEVLNKVAASLRRASGGALVAKAIGWGPWQGGMVTSALEARFAQMGVALIPLAEGARRFVDELEGSPDEVETVIGGGVGDGPLGATAGGAGLRAEINVSERSHPYLDDHRVSGKAVVPVAMAIEWMARAARAFRPAGTELILKEIRVLRGIKLEQFESGGDKLCVTSTPRGADLAMELRGAGGALYYSATLEAAGSPRTPPAHGAEPGALEPWARGPFYDGHLLFHGPSFQVIRFVDGVSREGLTASVDGARARGWPADAWRTDPALIDGALQLALLWAREVLGGDTLPMSVASFESFAEGLSEGPTRCVLRGREVHEARAVCDVALEDATGRPLALLRGIETVLRPGQTPNHSALGAGAAS